jgi:hypothetical protein
MNATDTIPRQVKTSTALGTALKLLSLGYWPIAIYGAGVPIKTRGGDKIATGKEPIGSSWGIERRDELWLGNAFKAHRDAGVGLCFGPGRAPGGGWLIDLEGDGPHAADSLASLLGGELLATVGWTSTRGRHTLFIADGPRLLTALQAAGGKEEKGAGKAGVWKLPALPDLEFRIGGFKSDETVKQLQSVIPPTPGTNGKPRVWTGSPSKGLADLPAAAYAFLEQLATSQRPAVKPIPHVANRKATTPAVERAIAYAKKIDPAISTQRGHSKTFYAACKIGPGFNLPEEVAFEILRDYYSPRCIPPWSDEEIRHKVSDAYRTEKKPPGFLLDEPGNFRRNGPPSANGHIGESEEEANEDRDDPHRLARIHARGDRGMRYQGGAWYRWVNGAHHPVSDQEITASATRAVKAEFDRLNRFAVQFWIKESEKTDAPNEGA